MIGQRASIRGLKAGTLTIKGEEAAGRYKASGLLQSGGLVGLVAKLRFDAAASGAVSGNGFSPFRYDENADTGKRRSRMTMTYSRGVPKVVGETSACTSTSTGRVPSRAGRTTEPGASSGRSAKKSSEGFSTSQSPYQNRANGNILCRQGIANYYPLARDT